MTHNFSITDNASKRIQILLETESIQDQMLRISISGGGCSGFQYHFVFDDQQLVDDQLFEHLGAKVVIDEISLGLLNGSQLDFVEDLAGSAFVIKNPNAASSCGCGNSFSV